MSTVLISNIKFLVNTRNELHLLRGKELAELPVVENAWLLVKEGSIADWGSMNEIPDASVANEIIDAAGRSVFPCWCDSHTHLVFAASREEEFTDKIRGLTYAEIASKGGGILNSARKVQESSESELLERALIRLHDLIRLGTGAIEIKSGYGLTVEAELKMLRVIKQLKALSPIPVKATFLGAHAFPAEYKENRESYIKLIMEEMLPAIAAEHLADYIDVFCENGFFTVEETIQIVQAGYAYGLKAKIHANQLSVSGGVEAGVALKALSVDHLESMNEASITALANSNTIGTLLPTAAYFLRMPFQPARALVDAGVAVALASDFNPGSSPSGNMNMVVSMSCIQMRLLPEEAINAASINGSFAMETENLVGAICRGHKANFFLTTKIPSIAYFPYAFGSNLVDTVFINGKKFS